MNYIPPKQPTLPALAAFNSRTLSPTDLISFKIASTSSDGGEPDITAGFLKFQFLSNKAKIKQIFTSSTFDGSSADFTGVTTGAAAASGVQSFPVTLLYRFLASSSFATSVSTAD
jgi:hypothetical protein